jgi:hypothetical protein
VSGRGSYSRQPPVGGSGRGPAGQAAAASARGRRRPRRWPGFRSRSESAGPEPGLPHGRRRAGPVARPGPGAGRVTVSDRDTQYSGSESESKSRVTVTDSEY